MTAALPFGTRDRARTRATLTLPVLLLALLVVAPGALAQVPTLPEPPHAEYKQIALEVDTTFVEVPFLGRSTVNFVVRDLSRDSTSQPGVQGTPAVGPARNQILVSMEPEGMPKPGWTASTTISALFLFGGQQASGQYFVQTAGSVRDEYVHYWLNATLLLPNGSQVVESERITARMLPFYRGLVQVQEPSRTVGQYEDVTFGVSVLNGGVYPDRFLLNVTAPPGFLAHIQPSVYVQPFETRIVNLTLKTPKDKLYDLGTPYSVMVGMRSANAPETTYSSVASLYVRGPYVSSYWQPILLLGLICLGIVARGQAEERELRRLERGLPRRPRPTPRTRVVLKELRKRDPDAYKERKARFAAVYATRRALYRERHKEAAREERNEKRRARVEWKEEKRARKAQRKEDKRLARIEAKRERAERKVARKRRHRLLKAKRKLEKKRARLAAKDAKRQARLDKRQAKADAKRAKAEAREEKKRAKAEKKGRRRS